MPCTRKIDGFVASLGLRNQQHAGKGPRTVPLHPSPAPTPGDVLDRSGDVPERQWGAMRQVRMPREDAVSPGGPAARSGGPGCGVFPRPFQLAVRTDGDLLRHRERPRQGKVRHRRGRARAGHLLRDGPPERPGGDPCEEGGVGPRAGPAGAEGDEGARRLLGGALRPRGSLFARLEGSTPFRMPGQEKTVRGRSWPIHDGILDTPWESPKMYKTIGVHAGTSTFTGEGY